MRVTAVRRRTGAAADEDEQQWISDAQIAETVYTAFEGTRHAITARLIVHRVKRLDPHAHTGQDELFPQYRYHAVYTDSPFILVQAEAQHRGHVVTEQVNADLIEGSPVNASTGMSRARASDLHSISHGKASRGVGRGCA